MFLVSIGTNVSNVIKQETDINNDNGNNNYNRKCEQVTTNLSVWILSGGSGVVVITTAYCTTSFGKAWS